MDFRSVGSGLQNSYDTQLCMSEFIVHARVGVASLHAGTEWQKPSGKPCHKQQAGESSSIHGSESWTEPSHNHHHHHHHHHHQGKAIPPPPPPPLPSSPPPPPPPPGTEPYHLLILAGQSTYARKQRPPNDRAFLFALAQGAAPVLP
eukprot:171089-Pelagomonas_calceolata.AAC.4